MTGYPHARTWYLHPAVGRKTRHERQPGRPAILGGFDLAACLSARQSASPPPPLPTMFNYPIGQDL